MTCPSAPDLPLLIAETNFLLKFDNDQYRFLCVNYTKIVHLGQVRKFMVVGVGVEGRFSSGGSWFGVGGGWMARGLGYQVRWSMV